eukprot:12617414-Alexandrium_andersonii.AAC.1
MARAIEEERRRLKADAVAATGQFDSAITAYTEDQAKVACFRSMAMLKLEPTRVADVKAGYQPRRARQRLRDKVRALQHIAVCAGLFPAARLGPLEYPQAPQVRSPPRSKGNPRKRRPPGAQRIAEQRVRIRDYKKKQEHNQKRALN